MYEWIVIGLCLVVSLFSLDGISRIIWSDFMMDEEKIKAMYADVVDVLNKHNLKYEEDLMCATILLENIIRYGAESMSFDDEKANRFIDDVLDSVRRQIKGENGEE